MTTETKFTVGEYKTRCGADAKLFIVNKDGTLVGARQFTDGSWSAEMWFSDGRVKVIGKTPHDLMPPLREWWIVAGQVWDNEREAIESIAFLHSGVKPIHVREVRDDQA